MTERKPLLKRITEKVTPKKPKASILPSDRPALSAKEQEWLNALLISAALNGKNSEIVRLIRTGADITATDSNGWTALHEAAWNGHTKTCALLIKKYVEAGEDIKQFIAAKSKDKWTALHFAGRNEYHKICILLIIECAKAGGDTKELIAAKSKDDTTAYDLASGKTAQFLKSMEWLMGITGNAFMASFGDCIAA